MAMNIRELEYFHELANGKNFSQVAKVFNVRQPTVTMAIQRLEEEYATPLVVRDSANRTLRLTVAGQQLEAHIAVILRELAVARQELSRVNEHQLILGLPPIIGSYYFPRLTKDLLSAGLMHMVRTVETGSRELFTQIMTGEIDAALLGSAHPITDSQLTVESFMVRPVRLIVSPHHPLAAKKHVSFADLRHEHFILPTPQFVHYGIFRELAQQAHIRPHIRYQTSNFKVIKELVNNNDGISIIADIAIESQDHLVGLTIDTPTPPRFYISLVYQQNHVFSSAQQTVINLITTLFNQQA